MIEIETVTGELYMADLKEGKAKSVFGRDRIEVKKFPLGTDFAHPKFVHVDMIVSYVLREE